MYIFETSVIDKLIVVAIGTIWHTNSTRYTIWTMSADPWHRRRRVNSERSGRLLESVMSDCV